MAERRILQTDVILIQFSAIPKHLIFFQFTRQVAAARVILFQMR